MQPMRILCLGAGRMAKAMIAGLIHNSGLGPNQIIVANQQDAAKLASLKEQYGVQITTEWQRAVRDADVILLAIPPQAHAEVLRELSQLVRDQLVVTVAAGTGPAYLEQLLPPGTATAWVMPNTAAQVGESMSLCARGSHVTAKHDAWLSVVIDSIGSAHSGSEQEVERLTAITGSAPVFVYRLAGALEAVCVADGFSPEAASALVRQMIFGSAKMLLQGQQTEALIDEVASPGGTTAAGLAYLDEVDFERLIGRAVDAIHAREALLANRSPDDGSV